jgi:hypothetical protein
MSYTDLLKLKKSPIEIPIPPTQATSPMPHQKESATVYPAAPAEAFRENFAGTPEIGQTGNPASRQAPLPERPTAGKTESLLARNLAACVQMALETKAAKKESFRFPEELMEVLDDLPHEIKKTYGKRISKTAVFVAAFAAYLWEFKHQGQDSLLYKQLIEK